MFGWHPVQLGRAILRAIPKSRDDLERYSGGRPMTTIFAKAGIAALISLAAVSAGVSTASATSFGAAVQDVRYDPHRPRVCSPIEAVRKARARGLRNTHVAGIAP